MDVNGLQDQRYSICSLRLPACSGLARVFHHLPFSASPSTPKFPTAGSGFSRAVSLLTNFVSWVDSSADRLARFMIPAAALPHVGGVCKKGFSILRRQSPLMDSINAYSMRPLNDPVDTDRFFAVL